MRAVGLPGTLLFVVACGFRVHETGVPSRPGSAQDASGRTGDATRVVDGKEASSDAGALVEVGRPARIDFRHLEPDVHVEVRPVEFVPAAGEDAPEGVRCTVRLRRRDGRDIGQGRVWVELPPDPAGGDGPTWERCCPDGPLQLVKPSPRGEWTRGPDPGWTGVVLMGQEVSVYFDPPKEERLARYGWNFRISATPADSGHVRLRVRGGALACIR